MREYLKDLRVRADMTQVELAERLGIGRAYYTRIENGERQQKMSISLAQKLSEIFDVPINYILEQENQAS